MMNILSVGNLFAQEQWIALVECFNNTTQSIIIELQSNIQTLLKNGSFDANYLLKAKTLIDHLAIYDEILPEKSWLFIS